MPELGAEPVACTLRRRPCPYQSNPCLVLRWNRVPVPLAGALSCVKLTG